MERVIGRMRKFKRENDYHCCWF